MNKLFCISLLLFAGIWAQSQTPGDDLQMRQGGHVRFDADGNGCSGSDIAAPVRMTIRDDDGRFYNFVNADTGMFGFLPGTYRVSPEFENPAYFNVSPASANIVFGGNSMDFCVTPNGIHRDAEVFVVPDSFPQAGHQTSYKVIVRNKGNQTLSGTATLFLPRDVTYESAFPLPQSRTETTLHWVYDGLLPFQSQIYTVRLGIDETNTDGLALSANITMSETDETPGDNTFDIRQSLLTPGNPNNKICLQGDVAPPSMIGQYLNYVINFANTGTTTIQKVVINDEIDTNQFEIASLQFTGLSHPGIPIVIGNKVEVYFQNIALTPGAQGAVTFKIKTKSTLPAGSTVSNKAKIYFDFNFPIETNSANTTFQLLGVAHNALPMAKVYPNPVGSALSVEANQDILSVVVTDAQGRTIAQFPGNGNVVTYDAAGYTSGLYCLKVTTTNGTVVCKFIKQ